MFLLSLASRPDSEVTQLLRRLSAGDREGLDRLLAVVYDELRGLARDHLRRERADHTLQPTDLVHEAFLRLVDHREIGWSNRAHFFGTAAGVIRRILVDHARARRAAKRGGDQQRLSISGVALMDRAADVDLLELEDALEKLAAIDTRQARIVELRFYGGLTIEEVADLLDMGKRSVDREWRCARLWLYSELRSVDGPPSPGGSPDDGP